MSKEDFKDVVLNPKEMLVTRVHDYFTKASVNRLNTSISSDSTFDVGIIDAIGEDIPKEWENKILCYHSKMGTEIEIKGISGKFELVSLSAKLIVRLDQDRSNY